jgi:hypothetical protein
LPSTAYSAFLKLVDLSSGPSPVDFIRSARSRARARLYRVSLAYRNEDLWGSFTGVCATADHRDGLLPCPKTPRGF